LKAIFFLVKIIELLGQEVSQMRNIEQ